MPDNGYRPRYKDVIGRMREFIKETRIAPDGRLPSEREFTKMFGASQPTVNKAIACLVSDGTLRREGYRLFLGNGFRVPHRPESVHVLCPSVEYQRETLVKHNLVEAAHDVCSSSGCNVAPLMFKDAAEQLRQLSRLLSERCEGFIIWPLAGAGVQELLGQFERRGTPFILCDLDFGDYDFVGIDNEAGARKAVRHLDSLGHKEIAYISGPLGIPSLASRRLGYQQACLSCGLESSFGRIIEVPMASPDACMAALDRLLAAHPAVTAVFCSNDMIALHLINCARQRKLNVPADLSITGFDDIDASALSYPALTTVSQDFYTLGVLAVESLLRRFRSQNPSASGKRFKVRLEPELAVRRSCCAPPQRTRRRPRRS